MPESTPSRSAEILMVAESLYRDAAVAALLEFVERRNGHAAASDEARRWKITVEPGQLRELVRDLLGSGYVLSPGTAPLWQMRGTAKLEGPLRVSATTTADSSWRRGRTALLRTLRPVLRSRPGRALARETWRWSVGRHHYRVIRDVRFNSHGVFAPFDVTSVLVEEGIALVRDIDSPVIVDVGTATGAAAILLALERPDAHVFATDVSLRAIRATRRNAKLAGARVGTGRGSLLEPCMEIGLNADLIVSNVPFIPPSHVANLSPWALLGSLIGPGPDGLDLVRSLIDQAAGILRPSGSLLIEVLPEQVSAVEVHAKTSGLEFERIISLDERSDCVIHLRLRG